MNEQIQLVMNLHADRQPVQLDGGVRDVVPQPKAVHQPRSGIDNAQQQCRG